LVAAQAQLQIGGMMSYKIFDRFRQQEADGLALSVKFNRWSQAMIAVLIQEQEAKLVASDLPVDVEGDDNFWEEIG
jgi:hypothetical protein